MKVIFLDIDGVLTDTRDSESTLYDILRPVHLNCLKAIVDATKAQIVLSSARRLYADQRNIINNALQTVGLTFVDKTRFLMAGRAAEIKEWLNRHPDTEKFVILDDDVADLVSEFTGKIVKTTMSVGLMPEHVDEAIKILNS